MTRSLAEATGLPLDFNPATCRIAWDATVNVAEENARTGSEMAEFIAEAGARPTYDPIYRMYRNVAKNSDVAKIRAARLRYDVTVIPPGVFVGQRREFFRTAGHYHAFRPDGLTTYPEVYEVLSGRAYWLIQRPNQETPEHIEEIYAVEAGPGEKAIMPPGFGHISVNAFAEPLVMANWIDDTFTYDYAPYRSFRGSGYWLFESGGDSIEFAPNPNYRSVPEIKKLRPKELPEFGLIRQRPGYQLAANLEQLRFLSVPEEFQRQLTIEHCYRALAVA